MPVKVGKAERACGISTLAGRGKGFLFVSYPLLRIPRPQQTMPQLEGKLTDVLRKDNYKNIIPSANTLEEAINYINGISFARVCVHPQLF